MKTLKSIAGILIITVFAACFAGCGKTDPVIKVGNDEIPTLYSVVGERKVTGVSKGIENGVHYAEKTYPSSEVSIDDIEAYVNALQDEYHFVITMMEDSGTSVHSQLGNESVDEGKIIIIDINYDSSDDTTIQYQVMVGTLTRY